MQVSKTHFSKNFSIDRLISRSNKNTLKVKARGGSVSCCLRRTAIKLRFGSATTLEHIHVFRRLISQLLQHLPIGSHPPVQTFSTFDLGRLRETLPRWLDQFSSRRNNRVLLVIDSLDMLKVRSLCFTIRVALCLTMGTCATGVFQ